MTVPTPELSCLLSAIRACRNCVVAPQGKPLPHEPRPVFRASTTARLAVCSQAPGTKVHQTGIPFTDASGVRLREWMGVSEAEFYDEVRVAIVPMGSASPVRMKKRRRSSPAPRMRAALASRPVRRAVADRTRACGWLLCAKMASRRGGRANATRDHGRMAETPREEARASAAAPVVAQQCLAQRECVVREGFAAGVAPRGAATVVASCQA